jgi:TPP-dependent pyruvate/acetoin dehydrogenase alpha subunit
MWRRATITATETVTSDTLLGDGATSEGDFSEGLNLAGVQRVPLVVVVLNNGWAISTPTTAQTAAPTFAAKAGAAGVPGVRVDGNDVVAVHAATRRARVHAATRGPILLELVTYRMGAHTNSDDPTRYVPVEALEAWRARDPIETFRARLTDDGAWTDAEHQAALDAVDARLEQIVDRALARPIDPNRALDHVLAVDGTRLRRQREELARRVGPSTTTDANTTTNGGPVSWRS